MLDGLCDGGKTGLDLWTRHLNRRQYADAPRSAKPKSAYRDKGASLPTSRLTISPDLHEDRELGAVSVGRGTYAGISTFVTYLEDERIEIGRYCSIAEDVTLMSGGQHDSRLPSTWPFENFLDGRPNPTRTYRRIRDTRIGSDVWIGYGASIGNGAQIGHGAIIGTRAVVMSDVPPYAVVTGNRAEVHRMRFDEAIIEKLLEIAWWDWPPELLHQRREAFYSSTEEFVRTFG